MDTSSKSRALVLGGGGVTGIGWEVGVLAGLLDQGADLRAADAVIGTSAGAFVGANYAAGVPWAQVLQMQERASDHEPLRRLVPEVYQAWRDAFVDGAGDPRAVGVGFGRVARRFDPTMGAAERRQVVRSRLATDSWAPALRICVTDADTGELVVLGPEADVRLEEAVEASGAVPGIWPAVKIGGREWIDAGMVSAANAATATGHDHVVVLAPMPEGFVGIPSAAQDVAGLALGARALLLTPDEESQLAIGDNPYDPTRAGAAAAAGRRQGRARATDVIAAWLLPPTAQA